MRNAAALRQEKRETLSTYSPKPKAKKACQGLSFLVCSSGTEQSSALQGLHVSERGIYMRRVVTATKQEPKNKDS